ncbi:MAG: phage/plasmid primase, P4 family, partial [Leptospirales bacterium]|nr:phage/plasmid primase, P4 family [Leptospirales bacterium]
AKYIIEYLLDCRKKIDDDDRRNAWVEFIVKRARSYARDIMIKDARSVYPVRIAEFDKNPYLFNCQDCTIDLLTFARRDHSPDDFLSKVSNVTFDPGAKCERWEQFIHEIMRGDMDTARFLQKALGYVLSGDTGQECFFILYGSTTRNGKGTTMETALKLMGDYGCTAQPETIAQKRNTHSGGPSEDIARLKGARFVNMSEPDKGLRLNSALVKQMTGGDTITARFLHQNSFEFRPQYTLFINTNHLPQVHDDTIFAGGRVKLIPFERHFTESEQDKGLKAFFKQPGNISGIFNWFLEGFRLMQAEGLKQPQTIIDATNEYREESSTVGQFMRECLINVPSHNVPFKDVRAAYDAWCEENGYKPFNKGNLIKELRARGMKVTNSTGNKVYIFDCAIAANEGIPIEFKE